MNAEDNLRTRITTRCAGMFRGGEFYSNGGETSSGCGGGGGEGGATGVYGGGGCGGE